MNPAPSFYLYDDLAARRVEPFALTRPMGELRAGALLIRERWQHALGRVCSGTLTAPHLAAFGEFESPPCVTGDVVLPAGSILVNARCAPALARLDPVAPAWSCDGMVAVVRLAGDTPARAFTDGALTLEQLVNGAPAVARGWWIDRPWDLVRHLVPMLLSDLDVLLPAFSGTPPGTTVLGPCPAVVEPGATVEPMVVLDATNGPIWVRHGATVAAFTRLVGPCMIGPHTQVFGGRITACSIGEHCRVHGELSHSVFLGHANKGHDGFVGHSVLGRWTNLGAGTITSNLKNTYGPVRAWAPDGERDSGLPFLGSLMGDHAKSAIGTRLTTGTIVGAGASVLSSGLTPKVIPPFAFGDEIYRLDKFLQVAERVMARRGVMLGAAGRVALTAAYAARWGTR